MRISQYRSWFRDTPKLISPDPAPEPDTTDKTKLPPELLDQNSYNTLEQFYVNYAGGNVENINFQKEETQLECS